MIIVTLKSLKSLVTISEATEYHIVVKGRPDTIGTKLILCENAAPRQGCLVILGGWSGFLGRLRAIVLLLSVEMSEHASLGINSTKNTLFDDESQSQPQDNVEFSPSCEVKKEF